MRKLSFTLLTIVMTAMLFTGLGYAECLIDYENYQVCRETPANMPAALKQKTCAENNGRIVAGCTPPPGSGYCEVGQAGGLHIYMWGEAVTQRTCEGIWHGPGDSPTTSESAHSGGGAVETQPPSSGINAGGGVQGAGEADRIWQYVTLRRGDAVVREMKMPPMTMALISSNDSLAEVFTYYEKILEGKGWKTGSKFSQGNEGALIMTKGNARITIAASNKKSKKAGSLQYAIQLFEPAG